MKTQRILIIALLSNKKLKDKIGPLRKACPNTEIFVLRKKVGFPAKNLKFITTPEIFQNKSLLGALALLIKGLFVIPKINPTFILTYFFVPWGIIGTLLSRLYKKKIVNSVIGSDQILLEKGRFSKINLKLLENSDAIVVTGTKSKRKLEKWIKKDVKIEYIPNTINLLIQRTPFENREIDFTFIGNLVPIKRIQIIIKAFINLLEEIMRNHVEEKLPNLYIIGKGPENEKLKAIVEKSRFKKNVYFTGYQKDVNQYLLKTKFILLSSENEGLPVVLLEGMMSGCIPITVDVGDIRDLVTKDNGFLIKSSSSISQESLVKKFQTIMRKALSLSKSEYTLISKSNIEKSKKYDISYGGELWYKLISDLISKE